MKRILFFIILGLLVIRYTFALGSVSVGHVIYGTVYCIILSVLLYDLLVKKLITKNIPGFWVLLILFYYGSSGVIVMQLAVEDHLPLVLHLRLLKNYIFDSMILYFGAFLLIDNFEDAKRSLGIIIIVFSLLNIISQVLGYFGIEMFVAAEGIETRGRFSGGFKNANQMAYFMCFLIPYIYYFYREASREITRKICFIAIFMSIISVLMSGSNGGILALFLVLMLLMHFMKEYKLGVYIICITILFVSISLIIGENQYFLRTYERVSRLWSGNFIAAGTGRYDIIWPTLFKIFIDGGPLMIFGRGLGSIPELLLQYGKIYGTAHNLIFQAIVELGLLGFILCILFLYKVAKFIRRYGLGTDPFLGKIIIISLSAFFVGMCFSDLGLIIKFIALISGVSFTCLHYKISELEITMTK